MKLVSDQKGFSLVEVAIGVVAVGFLVAGGMSMMSSSQEVARYKETQNSLNEVKQTLLGYYGQYRYLPCPDTDGDGIENPPTHTGTCTSTRGFLPYLTLGVGANGDAWGEPIKYVVNSAFANSANVVNLCSPTIPSNPSTAVVPTSRGTGASRIQIQDLATPAVNISDWASFALISHGKNGRQTNASLGVNAFGSCSGINALEIENCDADDVLRFGMAMSDGNTIAFDDIVVWEGDMQLVAELRNMGGCVASIIPSLPSMPSTPTTTTNQNCTSLLWGLLSWCNTSTSDNNKDNNNNRDNDNNNRDHDKK